VRRRTHPRHNDLFAIFPDLPRARPRTREEQILRLRRMLTITRERATQRVAEQKRAVALVRARLARRNPRLR
jgi:hypothetical protein